MPHINKTKVRVIYADTDQMGVVYHSNYLKYFEIGRTELLRELGMSYKKIEEYGILFPVKEAFVDYKVSIKYDDLIVIHTQVSELKNVSIKLKYEIKNEDESIIYSSGYTLHPFIDRNGKIVCPNDDIYNILLKAK